MTIFKEQYHHLIKDIKQKTMKWDYVQNDGPNIQENTMVKSKMENLMGWADGNEMEEIAQLKESGKMDYSMER